MKSKRNILNIPFLAIFILSMFTHVNETEILDISTLSPGMFFLAVYSESGTDTFKLIKQ